MKEKFLKSNRRIAVLCLFILEFFISVWITPNQYDSAFFMKQMQKMSVFDFLGMRYETWTSRLIIEFVLCMILPQTKFVWALLNTGMMTILGYSILKIFVKEDDKSLVWMAICFLLLYPLNKVAATCDWGAGTVNYTWPLAMLLFSTISIQKMQNREKIAIYEYPLYMVALVFACNQEQTCLIATGVYLVFTVLDILKNGKKVHPFLFVQLILVIFSLVFTMTCPGNYVRKNDEITSYYMEFGSFHFLDKLSLGLTATLNHLLIHPNLVWIVFSAVCCVFILKKYQNTLYRAVALIPVVASLVLSVLKNIVGAIFPYLGIFAETLNLEQAMLTPGNYHNYLNFIPLMLSFVVFGSMAMNILLIFKNLKNNVAILIYGLGLMSRVGLGFSPTIFASADRTFLFFEFSLIIISILIWKEFQREATKEQVKTRKTLATGITILAILQYFQTVIYALMSQM